MAKARPIVAQPVPAQGEGVINETMRMPVLVQFKSVRQLLTNSLSRLGCFSIVTS